MFVYGKLKGVRPDYDEHARTGPGVLSANGEAYCSVIWSVLTASDVNLVAAGAVVLDADLGHPLTPATPPLADWFCRCGGRRQRRKDNKNSGKCTDSHPFPPDVRAIGLLAKRELIGHHASRCGQHAMEDCRAGKDSQAISVNPFDGCLLDAGHWGFKLGRCTCLPSHCSRLGRSFERPGHRGDHLDGCFYPAAAPGVVCDVARR